MRSSPTLRFLIISAKPLLAHRRIYAWTLGMQHGAAGGGGGGAHISGPVMNMFLLSPPPHPLSLLFEMGVA